jgi:hypothetical protein
MDLLRSYLRRDFRPNLKKILALPWSSHPF